jgi:mitochondrial fission protein ELM1
LVWALVSDHAGDNAQALALAEELGMPFETKPIYYTLLKRLPGSLKRTSLLTLDRRSRDQIRPPWPDLIIMVGPRPQPIGRYVKQLSGGHTKLVLIGRPRSAPDGFDLIFDTRQYLLPDAPNVHLLPLVMSRYRAPLEPTSDERAWLDSLPRPHLLLMIGGPIRYWDVDRTHIAAVVKKLVTRAEELGGSLIVTGSPRTPRAVLDRIRRNLRAEPNCRLAEGFPRFQVLMDEADELFPTGDSVSMMSESVIAGKPVGIAPVRQTLWGRIALGPESRMKWSRFRDLRRFWSHLRAERLAGTIDRPVADRVANPVVTAAKLVRELLGLAD